MPQVPLRRCAIINIRLRLVTWVLVALLVSFALSASAAAQDINELKTRAQQGDVNAQFDLGLKYQLGVGVKQDSVEAVRWYRKAAEQGDAHAQSNLGVMYRNGYGVPKDYAEAARWYRKAADQGDIGGQTELGAMYLNGKGVPKNRSLALYWYNKAAKQGDKDAHEATQRLKAAGVVSHAPADATSSPSAKPKQP
jgi:TPR repeat protein